MGAVLNGLSLAKVRPFGSGFLIFSDYGRPALRLAALMEIPVIYIFTHDSIGVGEDGPTHQPVEQLLSLRAIPGLITLRPGDANEVAEAWRVVMQLRHKPAVLVLSRQPLPTFDRTKYAPAAGVARGAYVLADAPGGAPEVLLLATGSEVHLCVAAHEHLRGEGHSQPRREHAELGAVRRPAAGVPRRRASSRRRRSCFCRTGVVDRVGALRRVTRPNHRDDHLRRVGASESTAEEVRLRTRSHRRGRRGCLASREGHVTNDRSSSVRRARLLRRHRRPRLQEDLPCAAGHDPARHALGAGDRRRRVGLDARPAARSGAREPAGVWRRRR